MEQNAEAGNVRKTGDSSVSGQRSTQLVNFRGISTSPGLGVVQLDFGSGQFRLTGEGFPWLAVATRDFLNVLGSISD